MNSKRYFIKYLSAFVLLGLILIITTNFINQKKTAIKPIENISPVVSPKITQTIIKPTLLPTQPKIFETNIPDKVLIKTAFVRQSPFGDWSEPWQDACEEAALLTVNDFYKNINPTTDQMKSDILKMIDFETQRGWQESINTSQMAIISQDYFDYKTKIISNPTINEIKNYLAQNIPVIVPADGKILFQENKYFSNGGPYYHNIVILGYDDALKKFIVHDVGTQHGQYFQYSYNLLMDSIHDYPSSNHKEDIATGPKKILVLLK